MNKNELQEIISEGESTRIEFKRKISSYDKIAKEMVAFANTKGGYLLIGVDDDGTIVGVESEKNDINQLSTAFNFYIDPPIRPFVEIVSLSGKDIIVCRIAESNKKPHYLIDREDVSGTRGKVYIRVGEKSVMASREMTRILQVSGSDSKPIKLIIGENEKRLFAYLEKYERITVKEYARIVNISIRRAERLLVRLVRVGVLQIHVDTAHDYFTLIDQQPH